MQESSVHIKAAETRGCHTVYSIKQNAMCLDAVVLDRTVCEISGIFNAFYFYFFFPTMFKGFTHVSEPEVAVSPHPLHPAGMHLTVPCTNSVQIVLKVDSATGFF